MRLAIILLLLFSSISSHAKEISIKVKGMVCAFCAQGVTKQLRSDPNVEKADVSLETKTVTIHLKPGKDISDERLKDLITKAGLNLGEIRR